MNRLLSLILVLLLTASPGIAQEAKIPGLGGHIFVPTEFAPSPFINTFFTTSLGAGSSIQRDFPIVDLGNGELVGLDGQIIFIGLGFQYKQHLKDWIAFEAKANVSGRVGSDLLSLISQGFSTVNALDLGWLVKIYKSDRFMISGTAGVSSASGNFINLASFVEDIIDGDTTAQLSRKVNITNGGLGYRLAWSMSKLLGFSSSGSLFYGETFEGGRLYYLSRITASLDANLQSAYDVPLGFVYNIDFNGLPEFVYVNDRTAVVHSFKFAYMGSGDFSLGLEASFGLLPVAGFDEKVQVSTINITSQYFFK